MNLKIRSEDNSFNDRLTEMGIKKEYLMNSLLAGYAARVSGSEYDPPTFAGTSQYSFTIRMLRNYLIPLGWKISNKQNYCKTISPCGKYAIVVASGNDVTGDSQSSPTTKSSKGICTQNIVALNFMQLNLFEPLESLTSNIDLDNDALKTWLLLYYNDKGEIRGELSLPESIDNGYVTKWTERIILPSQKTEDPDVKIEPDFGPDVNIEIKKKN